MPPQEQCSPSIFDCPSLFDGLSLFDSPLSLFGILDGGEDGEYRLEQDATGRVKKVRFTKISPDIREVTRLKDMSPEERGRLWYTKKDCARFKLGAMNIGNPIGKQKNTLVPPRNGLFLKEEGAKSKSKSRPRSRSSSISSSDGGEQTIIPQAKAVHFSLESPIMCEILHRNDISIEEKIAAWFTRYELRSFKENKHKIAALLDAEHRRGNFNTGRICSRGCERARKDGGKMYRLRRAVLFDELNYLRANKDAYTPNELGELFRAYTSSSVEQALDHALEDERCARTLVITSKTLSSSSSSPSADERKKIGLMSNDQFAKLKITRLLV